MTLASDALYSADLCNHLRAKMGGQPAICSKPSKGIEGVPGWPSCAIVRTAMARAGEEVGMNGQGVG